MMQFGSLFSGVGGFDLGLERAGMTPAFQCEIDPAARRVLARHWPDVTVHNDVSELSGERCPAVDVLCGGFPCQDLSVAGRRAGLAGERSGLFHEFMRLADELAPRWVLVENVPGLLSSNDGADMGVVLGTLGELGYGWAYRILDAQYFGVAQRRRRVFIVGCAGDAARAAQVLFEPQSCDGDSPPSREPGPRSAPDPEERLAGGGAVAFDWQAGDEGGDGRSWIVKKGDYPRPGSNTPGAIVPVAFHATQDPISSEVHTPALGAGNQQGCATVGVAYPVAVRGRDEGQEWEMGDEQVYNALRAGDGGSSRANWIAQPLAVRRLTPLECERLQGFPDGWTDGQPDSTRYKQLGNAICVPVAEWIGRRIVEAA